MVKCKCGKYAKFNWPTEIVGLFCGLCSVVGMVNVLEKRKCQECERSPSYNFKGQRPLCCTKHKKEGMIDVKNQRCEKCDALALYRPKGTKKLRWCKQHKEEGAETKDPKCLDCGKRAVFGSVSTMKAEYCAEHKKKDMQNLVSKRCEDDQCALLASYGFTTRQFCAKHKSKGMKPIGQQTCLKCDKFPCFNNPGESKGLYCSEHKEEGMVCVTKNKCEKCQKQPIFNFPDEKVGKMCNEHKEKGMINIQQTKCIKCPNKAVFGKNEKSRATVCEHHMIEGYINVMKARQCSKCLEDYQVICGDVKYCLQHCPSNEYEAAIKRLCKYCDIKEDVTHVCASCLRTKNAKEYAIVRHIRRTIDVPFIHDSMIPDQNCSRKRPDIYFDLPDRVVIIEVDEHQHRDYKEECENSRMCEIVASIGGRPVTFIRYNPDQCRWKGKAFKPAPDERIDLLTNVVKDELVNDKNTFEVKLMQLWFDDELDEYTPCKILDITNIVAI